MKMKIFVSWSGEKSRLYAEALKDWLEQCIQSVEVFFSSEDIEKGINWNTKLSTELSDTNFGIVCLTNDNISAPWIHFEAGALSKFLSSKVTALVTDISISDIKGPLASFQATKLEKEDMLKLLKSINKELEHPIEEERLTRNFNAFYNDFEDKIKKIDDNKTIQLKKGQEKKGINAIVEEILQLVRGISNYIEQPERLLPIEYFEYMINRKPLYNEKNLDYIMEELYNFAQYFTNIYCKNHNSLSFKLIRDFEILCNNISEISPFWRKKFKTLFRKNKEIVC